jgi:hypothetical protein
MLRSDGYICRRTMYEIPAFIAVIFTNEIPDTLGQGKLSTYLVARLINDTRT